MSSQAFGSDLESAYDRLHPKVRRWIRDQGWDELREIQARTILALIGSDRDALIAASTAAGKTEAAFLPILTEVADNRTSGFSVVYISPLKALINDQFRRLDALCGSMEIPVVKWHGDASQSEKKKALAKPDGIVLITPESIEAMLVRRPADAKRLLSVAKFIVVDEVHAFLQGPRGLHISSLLRRIDAISDRPARRVGLSATIGDLAQAASWLRPTDPRQVEILEARSEAPELRLQIRGYVDPPDLDDPDHAESETGKAEDLAPRIALDLISDHLFSTLRGENNLIFGGSRRTVESVADRLRRRSEKSNVPNEFHPHHGSLSKTLREELEERLKEAKLPTTAVCTSTLELGVDIGSVKSVAQIGAPISLSSLRQRLGRTGRRAGTPSILRIYLREPTISQKSGILDRLRPNTIRAVAAVRLLLQKFVEEASASPETASTLVHQIMSVIAERGGIGPKPLYDLLCGPGPFASIGTSDLAALLRHMASKDINFVEQAPDGVLMLAEEGEKTVQSRDFFAVFESGEEWRLTVGSRTLGTLPLANPVHKDGLVVFAGQRWIIQDIDEQAKVLGVVPHPGGVIPRFDKGGGEPVHDRLVAEMRAVYMADDVPPYLDGKAIELLAEGRATFRTHRLDARSLVEEERDLHIFLWRGSIVTSVFGAALAMAGLASATHDLGLTVSETEKAELRPILKKLSDMDDLDPLDVASFVSNIKVGKFREAVPDQLARELWARQNGDRVKDAVACAGTLQRASEVDHF